MVKPGYNDLIFINCPFDDDYKPMLYAIVFEKERFTYQKYISDLSGIDTKAHEGDPNKIIAGIRDWLRTASERTTIPGSALILRDYKAFTAKLPDITQRVGLDYSNIPFNDYCQIVEEAVSNVI